MRILTIPAIVLDGIFIVILAILSLYLTSFLLNASYIQTGYPDWMVHAFRIKSLQEFGFSSWTHVWSNGISLWKAYQFVPHYITLFVAEITHVTIPRAMVLTTIGLFFFLRFSIYVIMRLLSFSPLTAFSSSVLSFDIAQYWGGVSDFSILFGFTFFPLVIFLWVKYYQGKIQYLFPYLVGLLFYIHILLGVVSFALMFVTILFTGKNIFSKSSLLQIAITLASSSLFWFPLVYKNSYSYSSTVFANKYFLNLVLSGYSYVGLSLALVICFLLTFFRIFMPVKYSYNWVKIFFTFIASYLLLVVVGLSLDLPRLITQFQFTRGATFIGIGIIFAFAPFLERFLSLKSSLIKGICMFFLGLVFIESLWFASIYSPSPASGFEEPIHTLAKQQPNLKLNSGRIWTSSIDLASFYGSFDFRYPYSYMGHLESNQIPQRITQLLNYSPFIEAIPKSSMDRIENYFKVSGVKYAFFEENSPFTKELLKNDTYTQLARIEQKGSIFRAFQVPWDVKNALLVDNKYISSLKHFPFNLEFSDSNDQIALDDYMQHYSNTFYKSENKKLAISYPTQESIAVSIPANRSTKVVYINESFDANWIAKLNGRQQKLTASGPNFILVNLDNLQDGGILFLKHTWPISFYVSWFLILFIPLEIGLIHVIQTYILKKNYEIN